MRKLVLLAVVRFRWRSSSRPRQPLQGALSPAQASAACAAFFGVSAGPEPLSACQWDMRRIEVGTASYARATGEGVSVGVIDGGVDFDPP